MRKLLLGVGLAGMAAIFTVNAAGQGLPGAPGTPPVSASSVTLKQAVKAGGAVAPGAAAPGGPPGAAPAGAAAAPAPLTPTPRMEKLKTLQFDRRPSTVFEQWAPKPKADDTKTAPKTDEKAAALEKEIADYRKAVTIGDWDKVKSYLASLPDEEAILAYKQTVTQLQRSPGPNMPRAGEAPPDQMQQMLMNMIPGAQRYAERNSFTVSDVLALANAAPRKANEKHFAARAAVYGPGIILSQAPKGLDKEHLTALAGIFNQAIQSGTLIEVAVEQLKTTLEKAGENAPLDRRQNAKVLVMGGFASYAGDFLPSPEEAQKARDLEGLNLLALHYLAMQSRETDASSKVNLEKAWNAVQAVLEFPDEVRDQEQQDEALLRAVELAPRVKDTLGQAWLDESFTKKPDRGMMILAKVGTLVSQGLPSRPFATEERLNALKLMKTAVDALLKAAPEKAKEWQTPLTLLAAGWFKEADFSRQYDRSSSGGPVLRRDVYGNIFYSSGDDDSGMPMQMYNQQGMPRPITVAEVMKARPSDEWVAATDEGFRPKLAGILAQLHLKAGEEEKAFPLIEQLAPAQPDEAKRLVREFIQVWTRNHDPNANRNQYRYSWIFYGFENRAESIPLTRSKQERNLEELAKWSARIKKLPLPNPDEELLVKAFTACHSSAEVYKTEAIEKVFGPLGGLKPRTLAGLAQQMRGNLAGLWRDQGEQQNKKTNRKKKDIEQEVLRGYAVARTSIEDGLKKFPNHWALLLAQAAILHDEVNYQQDLSKSSDFSAKRAEALGIFAAAAAAYAKAAPTMPEEEHTTQVHEYWLYASLGAVDLGYITEDKQFAAREPAKIKAALESLPGELAEQHVARFANNLFTRMSGAKPHIKFRYLKAGFDIVGEHPRASEAKKVFDYYKDLVTEIKLDVLVDGSPKVSHGKPFGLFVNLRHTRDIERESGGFGRYLQNQNSYGYYSYNYGRPTADYRDRFESVVKEALKEQFEVISVTFQNDSVNSRSLPEFGWRYTPYAYVLLKARGPHVDKVPPLRLDLDFLDTSGYVVLPVESPTVPIDCQVAKPELRPLKNLSVTQTLDERQASKGNLLLEVKATAVGLIPDLDELCDFQSEGFEIAKTEDQGIGVKKFDEDLAGNAILSERTWLLTLKGQEGLTELPKTFRFATVKLPTKETDGVIYQRYNDADLTSVEQMVSLEQTYGEVSRRWLWLIAAALILFGTFLGLLIWLLVKSARKPATDAIQLPKNLNAFTVLQLLEGVKANPNLNPSQRAELDAAIAGVEKHYFADERNGQPSPDLRHIAERWVTFVK